MPVGHRPLAMKSLKSSPKQKGSDLQEVAQTILCNALADPEREELLKKLIAAREAGRRELVLTAFTLGAMAALQEVMQGDLIIAVQSDKN
jgi:hypothetical protein